MSLHEPGVFYHVAGPGWRPGAPLLSWNRQKEIGLVTDDDWAHPAVPVGHDGDLISLWPALDEARWYAGWKPRPGETIVRVRFPPGSESIVYNSEEVPCYPGPELPADWIEVVMADEEPWSPPRG